MTLQINSQFFFELDNLGKIRSNSGQKLLLVLNFEDMNNINIG